jgi:hypothetical protein
MREIKIWTISWVAMQTLTMTCGAAPISTQEEKAY